MLIYFYFISFNIENSQFDKNSQLESDKVEDIADNLSVINFLFIQILEFIKLLVT